jgi:hypothetical protein
MPRMFANPQTWGTAISSWGRDDANCSAFAAIVILPQIKQLKSKQDTLEVSIVQSAREVEIETCEAEVVVGLLNNPLECAEALQVFYGTWKI